MSEPRLLFRAIGEQLNLNPYLVNRKVAAVKFPDLFYIKQTKILNNLHAFSFELLGELYKHNNPNNAYDSEWGKRQIHNLTMSIRLGNLEKEPINRLLRPTVQSAGYSQRPELERDMIRLESIRQNIECELGQLSANKATMAAWIQVGILAAILIALCCLA